MESDTCTICAEPLAEGQTTTIECGHAFHTSCVLQWFRYYNDSCPNCRDEGNSDRFDETSRATRMRTLRRKRNLPWRVRVKLQKMDDARAMERQLRRDLLDYRRQHAPVLSGMTRLRTRIRHYATRYHCLHRELTNASGWVPLLQPREIERRTGT